MAVSEQRECRFWGWYLNPPLVVGIPFSQQGMVLRHVNPVSISILCGNEINILTSFYRAGFGVCCSYRAVFLFMSHSCRETPWNRYVGPSTERTVGYKKPAGLWTSSNTSSIRQLKFVLASAEVASASAWLKGDVSKVVDAWF
jgi:hypothetical protein